MSFDVKTHGSLSVITYCGDLSSLAHAGVENLLADAQTLRSHLQELIGVDEVDCLLEGENLRRDKAERLIGCGGARVGEVFGLADIAEDILALAGFADYHAGINLGAGCDEEVSSLLCIEEAVGDCLAGFKRDEGTLLAVFDITLVRLIVLENGVHDAGSLGVRQE